MSSLRWDGSGQGGMGKTGKFCAIQHASEASLADLAECSETSNQLLCNILYGICSGYGEGTN